MWLRLISEQGSRFNNVPFVVHSIAEIVERYKKEQIVEGHVLCTPVVKVLIYHSVD